MTPVVAVKAVKCIRCNHVWLPKTDRKPKCCASCKSTYWDKERERKYFMRNGKRHWKSIVSTIALASILALALTIAPTTSYAAKSASDSGSGSSSSSSKDSGKSSSGSGGGGSTHDSTVSDSGGSSSDSKDSNSKTVDDGFTSKDGVQPTFPIGKDGKPTHSTMVPFPGIISHPGPGDCVGIHTLCKIPFPLDDRRHHHDHNDNVKVIQKTVVVHDNNNHEQNIVIIQNPTTGACIVTAEQINNTPHIVEDLLNQCNSLTILSGNNGVIHNNSGSATATATARAG